MKATSGTVTAGKLPLFRVHSFQPQDKLDRTLFIWCWKAHTHPPRASSAHAFNANRHINSFLFQPFRFRSRQSGVLASAGKPMLLLHFKTSHIHQIQDNTSRKLLQSQPTSCRGPLSSHLLPTSVLSLPRPA